MAHEPSGSRTDVNPDNRVTGAGPGMPRWVKVGLSVAAVLAVVIIVGMLFVGGDHGPGQHLPGDEGRTGELGQHGGGGHG